MQIRRSVPQADIRSAADSSLFDHLVSTRHSPNGTLWNVAAGYSGFAPDNFTTLPHFSVSSAMSLPKSAGEPRSTVPAKSANRAFNLGSASPVLISVLSFPMISGGVFLGAQRPTHWLASKPLTKSPTVGISGSASDRVAVVTAKARSLPALMYSIDAAMSV